MSLGLVRHGHNKTRQSGGKVSCRPANPQQVTPALFVPWQEIATQVGIPVEHEASPDGLQVMFNAAIGALAVEEQREFDQWQGAMVGKIPKDKAPVEMIAPLVLSSMYEAFPAVPHCDKLFWHMAQAHGSGLLLRQSPRRTSSGLTVVA